MKLKLAPGLSIEKSPIDGNGCFATTFFPKGKKIAEYAGELITHREVARRVKTSRKHRICASGRVRDSVYFSIIAEEWPEVKRRLEGTLAAHGVHLA